MLELGTATAETGHEQPCGTQGLLSRGTQDAFEGLAVKTRTHLSPKPSGRLECSSLGKWALDKIPADARVWEVPSIIPGSPSGHPTVKVTATCGLFETHC